MLRPGPKGPNAYDELRQPAAETAERQEPPPQSGEAPESVTGLRVDNAEMAADTAAAQRAEQRAEVQANDKTHVNELAEDFGRTVGGLGQVDSRFGPTGQNPTDYLEQKYLERNGELPPPSDPFFKSLRESGASPCDALRHAAMAEDIAFQDQYAAYDKRIKAEPIFDARRSLQQRQEILTADHLAEGHHRVADLEELRTGSEFSAEVAEHRDEAAEQEERSRKVRESYRLRTGRDAHSDGRTDESLAAEAGRGDQTTGPSLGTPTGAWEPAGEEVTSSSEGAGPTRPSKGGISY